jgi:hypothetical protein
LSSKYDQGLEKVNRQLEDLSAALATLLENSNNNKISSNASPAARLLETAASTILDDHTDQHSEVEAEGAFEGESSFVTHSRRITETLGIALSSSSPDYHLDGGANPNSIDQSLIRKLLHDVADVQPPAHPPKSSPQYSLARYPEVACLKLPPMDVVLRLLRLCRTAQQRFFIDYQLMTFESFSAMCQSVYFPTVDYTVFTWMIVNTGIFQLLRDIDGTWREQLGISLADHKTYAKLCQTNVDTATHSLKLTVDPSLDACQAIALAGAMALEEGKPALAWKMVSISARMCLDLGLHRLSSSNTDDDDDARRKIILFWYVYSVDKGLAFNFGRTPTIHDYDIIVDRPKFSSDDGWGQFFSSSLEFSVLQGAIYEQLFSVSAQRLPVNERSDRAKKFANEVEALRNPLLEFSERGDHLYPNIVSFTVLSSDMLIYCLLTIVYRVIPPPQPAHPLQFCDEAVQSARTALELLFKAWNALQDEPPENWAYVINWTIMFVPFVPFIVIFGNAIAKNDFNDLLQMQNVVSVLELAADRTPGNQKLHRTCSQLTKVAEVLLAQSLEGKTLKETSSDGQEPSPLPPDVLNVDFDALPDFPMTQEDWDGMLNDWDLGVGAEDARGMKSYFEPFMNANQ